MAAAMKLSSQKYLDFQRLFLYNKAGLDKSQVGIAGLSSHRLE